MIKTRVQTQGIHSLNASAEETSLLRTTEIRKGAIQVAREAYRNEGISVFFRGLGICSARAFIVNAVQWAVYEWMMQVLKPHSEMRLM